MQKALVCSVCGYVHLKENAPEKCPVCGAASKVFSLKDDALKTKEDIVTVGESHKKHLPLVVKNLMKCCNDENSQCQQIMVRVGELVHPMTPEHYITNIMFYADKEYVGGIALTPELKPAGAISLDVKDKKISVVAQCNIHGNWLTELE